MRFKITTKTIIGIILILLIIGGLYLVLGNGEKREKQVRVDISGAVQKPGVYQVVEGSIVQDAINNASGYSSNVDKKRVAQNINLAQVLSDGDKIYIPIIADEIEQNYCGGGKTVKININHATMEEIELLPGIGPVSAARIISYRRQNGEFKKLEELMKVYGITEQTFSELRDLACI